MDSNMTAIDIINQVQTIGIRLASKNGKLVIDAPKGVLTEDLKHKLKAHKAELLTALEESIGAAVITTCEGATTSKVSTGLHPYHYRLKNDKGGGTYLTPAATLEEARAELLCRWPDELVMVTRGG